jgi:phenylpyruvate tautomerase PptA (4-oxalocrotonate tautomerase family)
LPDGTYAETHGVHVYVDWFEGRSEAAKALMANIIEQFLLCNFSDPRQSSDVTFHDLPPGSFYRNGKKV